MISVPSYPNGHLIDWGIHDPSWHSMKIGDIFYTDDISRTEKFHDIKNVYGIY